MLSERELEWRRGGIGSSECGVIAGHSIYQNATPYRIFMSKVFGEHGPQTNAMELGSVFENGIAQWYLRNLGEDGLNLRKATSRVHRERRWQRATPDFYVTRALPRLPVRENGRRRRRRSRIVRILECKLVGAGQEHHWNNEDPAGIPELVRDQVTWQMDATGIRTADVAAVFTSRRRGDIWRVEYDAERAAHLREVCERFWKEHILAKVPPPIDGSEACEGYLQGRHSQSNGRVVSAPYEAEAYAKTYDLCRQNIKGIERIKATSKNSLIELIRDNEGIEGRWGKATWLEQNGKIDWQSVAVELGAILLKHGTYPYHIQKVIEKHRAKRKRVLRVTYKEND